MPDAQQQFHARLEGLRREYRRRLPDRLRAIQDAWREASMRQVTAPDLRILHKLAHGLAGSGATFGCDALSHAAHNLELFLKSVMDGAIPLGPAQRDQVGAYLTGLALAVGDVAERPPEAFSGTPEAPSEAPVRAPGGEGPVFLVEDDALQARELAARIEARKYTVRSFHRLDELGPALAESRPAALIADIMFPEGDLAGAEVVRAINADDGPPVPTLFISARDDFEARLAAVRAGGTHYFTKPLDLERLLDTLERVTEAAQPEPYRILVVDDDAALASMYRLTLEQAGLAVHLAGDALQAMAALTRFRPELILMDIYMPGCTGLELAAVIRQQDRYAHIPIVFLSTETNLDQQLAALSLGGDEYLTKPVKPWRLLATIKPRVKRARKLATLSSRTVTALRELESQKFALDQHCGVTVADTEGLISYVNPKFSELSGYRPEELLGRDHRLLKSGHHPKAFFAKMWADIGAGRVWQGEIQNRRKDGGVFWVETTIVPFLDASGSPYQYVAIRTDITAGKAAEQALRESRERLRLSQNYANLGTWDWNIETDELHWSERIAPLFGYPAGELETTYEGFLGAVHPDDRPAVTEAARASVEDDAPYEIEHRVIWPDGTVRWLRECGGVARDGQGKPSHMLGVVQDITRRKRVEDELIRARDEAQRANKAKSEFLSHMSHELRTPLNVILGFAQLLGSDTALETSQRDGVQHILKAGWHLLQLINEVLDLAKIEAGRIDLSLENVDLAEVLDECRALIAPLADQHGVSLGMECRAECSGLVHADRTRLKQALLNLLTNGVKYNREGGALTLALERTDADRVRIEVIDTGAGLSDTQIGQLFEPFNRLGAEFSGVEGSGIGLTITRHLVHLMGGDIGVESVPGEGSTFWIEFAAGTQPSVSGEAEILDTDGTAADAAERTVLYVEDNPANMKLMAQLVARRPGLKLISAGRGDHGLELARSRRPDLIILDINLPGMDGFEIRARLKHFPETADIPVIALSANAMPKDVERGLGAGFARYLAKPVRVERFLQTLDELFAASDGGRKEHTEE